MYAVINSCQCGSDWVEERLLHDLAGCVHYFYTCLYCGKYSSKSIIQAEALKLWNDENPTIDEEIENMNAVAIQEEIEEIEAEIEELQSLIADKEKQLNAITKKVVKR